MIEITAGINVVTGFIRMEINGHSNVDSLCSGISAIMIYAEIAFRESYEKTMITRNKPGHFEIITILNSDTAFTYNSLIKTFVCLQKKYIDEITIKELN